MSRSGFDSHKQLNTNLTLVTMKKKSDSSQRERIKHWLEGGNTITPMEALEMFGCFRLAAIILILKRKEEMEISTTMVKGPNGKRYAQYKLVS